MTSTTGHDLGHGVRVMPGDGGGIVVQSADFNLGWRPRIGGAPGAAVIWEGTTYEVVEREPWRRGGRWTLEPWVGEDVMRVVLPLDGATVDNAANVARTAVRGAKLRPWFWSLSPVLGFATSSWQRRWRDDWGFPAAFATRLSALIEMVIGAVCMIELIAMVGGEVTVFPWIPRPLIYFGFAFFVEGVVRLAQVASDSEPVGTFFGLVVSVFERPPLRESESIPVPTARVFDEVTGHLELLSTIHRRDWEGPGLLPYRGEHFALDSTDRLGEDWVYVFHRVEVAGDRPGVVHRLRPPRSKVEDRSFADQPGIIKTVLLTIACTLAPRRFQERWAWELGVKAKWFTVLGASTEFIGGLSNLGAPEGQSVPTVLLNLFFIGEAMVRLGSIVFRGLPLGSVLGLPLAPVLERYLPDPGLPPHE